MIVREFPIKGSNSYDERFLFELEGELADEIISLLRIRIGKESLFVEATCSEKQIKEKLAAALTVHAPNVLLLPQKTNSTTTDSTTTNEEALLKKFMSKYNGFSPLLARACLLLERKELPYRILFGPSPFPPKEGGFNRGNVIGIRLQLKENVVDIKPVVLQGASHILIATFQIFPDTEISALKQQLEEIFWVRLLESGQSTSPLGDPQVSFRLQGFSEQQYSTDSGRVAFH